MLLAGDTTFMTREGARDDSTAMFGTRISRFAIDVDVKDAVTEDAVSMAVADAFTPWVREAGRPANTCSLEFAALGGSFNERREGFCESDWNWAAGGLDEAAGVLANRC